MGSHAKDPVNREDIPAELKDCLGRDLTAWMSSLMEHLVPIYTGFAEVESGKNEEADATGEGLGQSLQTRKSQEGVFAELQDAVIPLNEQ